ncbi:MAG TPA: HlyD family efflux transporter periplasmic adaptor subunit [Myxococcales bacterium]|nr:HlyD family efflux transporter periplasmic adaptor subunit [Myxococcales bacterium]
MAVAFALVAACGRGASKQPVEYQGVVELHERALGFEVPGRLKELKVKRGDRVEPGQVLATLDDSMEVPQRDARAAEARAADAQLDLLKAGARGEDIRAAEAQLRGAKAAEDTLRDSLERTRKLRSENTVPQAQLDEVQGQTDRAVAERQAAEERLAALRAGARSQEVRAALARSSQAHAALDAEEARLSRFTLRAEIAGAVLDTHLEPGEVVQPGQPVLTVGETHRPYVDVFVPQGALDGIKNGTPAQVRVDAEAQRFSGAVESVGRTVEFTPRYLFSEKERPNLVVRVRVDLADPREALHAGVPAFASFQ